LGWDIIGLDKNYTSERVIEGSLTEMPFSTRTFDTILCLDVLEHLLFPEQYQALAEIQRVLKPGGLVIFSIPNLAHFTARLKFMFRGKLLRTASISHHPGDRPALEYERLFQEYGLTIVSKHGIFPTVPPLYRHVMRHPSKCANLLSWLQHLPFPTYWNFQVLFVCRYQPAEP
jgi:2-polyprenyl-3-methyl-5-hydroxy-6-metoxy-1,4-benzoquinol methylase